MSWQSLWPEKHRLTAADLMLIAWFGLILAILTQIWSWPVFIVLPILRLFDILYTRVYLLLRAQPPRSSARSILLLLMHYFEVVAIFACGYIWLGIYLGKPIFLVAGRATQLSSSMAFYFSLMTATTVGYGDITPILDDNMPFWLMPSTMIGAELTTVIFMLAIEVPRIFVNFGTKLTK